MPDEPTEYPPMPGSPAYYAELARRKAQAATTPPEVEEPPVMDDPPEPEQPEIVPVFRPAPTPPPVGASPLLKLILSTVSDPEQRQAIEEAAWAISDGREDHLLTKAAALLSAVQRANTGQMGILLDEYKLIAREIGLALRVYQHFPPGQAGDGSGLTIDRLEEFGDALAHTIVEDQKAEFAAVREVTRKAVQEATRSAMNQRAVAFFVGAFFAGMAFASILFFIFHK